MRRERGPYRYRRMQMLEGASDDAYRPGTKPRGTVRCPGCGHKTSKVHETRRVLVQDVPMGQIRQPVPAPQAT